MINCCLHWLCHVPDAASPTIIYILMIIRWKIIVGTVQKWAIFTRFWTFFGRVVELSNVSFDYLN